MLNYKVYCLFFVIFFTFPASGKVKFIMLFSNHSAYDMHVSEGEYKCIHYHAVARGDRDQAVPEDALSFDRYPIQNTILNCIGRHNEMNWYITLYKNSVPLCSLHLYFESMNVRGAFKKIEYSVSKNGVHPLCYYLIPVKKDLFISARDFTFNVFIN